MSHPSVHGPWELSVVRRYPCPLPAPVGTDGGKQKGEGGRGRRGRRGRGTVERKRKEGRKSQVHGTDKPVACELSLGVYTLETCSPILRCGMKKGDNQMDIKKKDES